MIEEKEDPDQVMYQLVVEDVQLEALELIGRRLTADELYLVKHTLTDFIHWDFYVREAIKEVVKSEEIDDLYKGKSLFESLRKRYESK